MILQPWWERYPERLEYELKAIEDSGIKYEPDAAAFAKGFLRYRLFEVPVRDRTETLILTFPDLYPYFRYELQRTSGEPLAHHEHYFGRNLCLRGRNTDKWHTSDTVSVDIRERLPNVYLTGESNDLNKVIGLEEPQAEPFSDYYQYAPSTMIMVHSEWDIPKNIDNGTFTIGTGIDGPYLPDPFIRGSILEICDPAGNVVATASDRIQNRYNGLKLEGTWLRNSEPIKENNPEAVARFLSVKAQTKLNVIHDDGKTKELLKIWGVLFPEEDKQRHAGQGWLFVCSLISKQLTQSSFTRDLGTNKSEKKKKRKEKRKSKKRNRK